MGLRGPNPRPRRPVSDVEFQNAWNNHGVWISQYCEYLHNKMVSLAVLDMDDFRQLGQIGLMDSLGLATRPNKRYIRQRIRGTIVDEHRKLRWGKCKHFHDPPWGHVRFIPLEDVEPEARSWPI